MSLYTYVSAGLIVFVYLMVRIRGMRYTGILGFLLVVFYLIATIFTFLLGFFVDRINSKK